MRRGLGVRRANDGGAGPPVKGGGFRHAGIQQVPGAGSVLKGDYDFSVVIGQLFDIEESTEALKRVFELVIGKRVWMVASYDSNGRLVFAFSQELWNAPKGAIVCDISQQQSDINYSHLGKRLVLACTGEADDRGVTLLSSCSMALYVKEEDVPEAFPRLHQKVSTLLPSSGHTIEWISPDSKVGMTSNLDAISSE